MAAVEEEAPTKAPYSPQEIFKLLSEIPEPKRTYSSSKMLDALTCQLKTLQAISAVQQKGDSPTLPDIGNIIMLFLKNVYNLVSGLPGALMFDALEDLMARSGLLAPFVNGVAKVDDTIVLELGLPTNESLADSHEELIRIAAAAVVCFFHYTNFAAHPAYFPSDDATLLFTTMALRSCQDRAAASQLDEQLRAAGSAISLGELRWVMHYIRAQLSGLCGDVFLSLGDMESHKQQVLAQQGDFLGLIKAVPENPAGYIYYVRTCLQFQQLSAAALFAAKGAVVAAHHKAHLYGAHLAAQRAIALALSGGKGGSGAASGASSVSAPLPAVPEDAAAADADAPPPPAVFVPVGELRSLVTAAREGLATEAAVLPEVYGTLLELDAVDVKLLDEKIEPLIEGLADDGQVLALSGLPYPTRPPQGLPRGAVAIGKPPNEETEQ